MASVNKVIILGNMGADPEMRYTASGAAIANLRIATSRSWKNKDTGERVEETEWHTVVLYDRQAEIAGEYLRKGRPVYIEGRLKTRKWQDKDGHDRYTTEVVGESLQLLGGRDDDNQSAQAPAVPRAPAAPRAAAPRPAPPASGHVPADLDDDIPF